MSGLDWAKLLGNTRFGNLKRLPVRREIMVGKRTSVEPALAAITRADGR